MGITAKELAEKLGLSATAVSMALNNRPGVSTETRRMILDAAEKYGYDFHKITSKIQKNGEIYFVIYQKFDSILVYPHISSEISDGIAKECKKANYRFRILRIEESTEDVQRCIEDLLLSNCAGVIVLATSMSKNMCQMFLKLRVPVIMVDNYYDTLNCTSVSINNAQGAYLATSHLIERHNTQPGHLRSSLWLKNFEDRRIGFRNAVRDHGMSASSSIEHDLSPSIEGAFMDMLELIEQKERFARCYFADNDLIALGAIRAFKLSGYKIPEDIAVIGFDDISLDTVSEPSLSSVSFFPHFYWYYSSKTVVLPN